MFVGGSSGRGGGLLLIGFVVYGSGGGTAAGILITPALRTGATFGRAPGDPAGRGGRDGGGALGVVGLVTGAGTSGIPKPGKKFITRYNNTTKKSYAFIYVTILVKT